jgi:aminoglycoside phosphotransferase (APT) family kinase protein
MELEQRWLPRLAPLPLEIPVPLRAGRPGAGYPWHWSVVPWIDGQPGDRTPITDADTSAERLGAFLRELHRPAPAGAPHNPFRSGPLATRADTFEARLEVLADHVDGPVLRRLWEDALKAPDHDGPPVWCHGDLHPANTLIRNGAVAAVIDFGDLCAGDPAVDVGAAWLSIPDESRGGFWSAYPSGDNDLERRALGWSILFSLMLLDVGLKGRPSYAGVARSALDRIVRTGAG